MKIEDIAKLKQEGFTAQEIVELAKIITADEPTASVPAPAAEVKQEPTVVEPSKEVQPEIDPVMAAVTAPVVEKKTKEPVVAPAGNSDPMAEILNQLTLLTKSMQTNARLYDRQPEIKEDSAEDALASILMG